MLELSARFLVVGIAGVILLLVGLIKKLKFFVKLGIVVAVIAFILTGGLAFLP